MSLPRTLKPSQHITKKISCPLQSHFGYITRTYIRDHGVIWCFFCTSWSVVRAGPFSIEFPIDNLSLPPTHFFSLGNLEIGIAPTDAVKRSHAQPFPKSNSPTHPHTNLSSFPWAWLAFYAEISHLWCLIPSLCGFAWVNDMLMVMSGLVATAASSHYSFPSTIDHQTSLSITRSLFGIQKKLHMIIPHSIAMQKNKIRIRKKRAHALTYTYISIPHPPSYCDGLVCDSVYLRSVYCKNTKSDDYPLLVTYSYKSYLGIWELGLLDIYCPFFQRIKRVVISAGVIIFGAFLLWDELNGMELCLTDICCLGYLIHSFF